MLARAKQIAFSAGEIVLEKFASDFKISKKGTIDLVTDADLAAEKHIIHELKTYFPEHGVLGEEGGRIESLNDLVWIIDPIDGTTNFAHGFPYFSVSIALAKGSEVLLGVVYNPVTQECFSAERGYGAYLNEEPIQVSTTTKLQDSLLVTGFSYNINAGAEDNMKSFAEATKASRGVLRIGSAALDLCQVASGRLDAFWERELEPWDMAAGSLIVLEAGGTLTTCSGQEFEVYGNNIFASNGLIHAELQNILITNN